MHCMKCVSCGVGWLPWATRQRLTDGGIGTLCVAAQAGGKKGNAGAKTACQPQTGLCAVGSPQQTGPGLKSLIAAACCV